LLQVLDRQRFVARRGVEHHERAVSLENFDLQLVPVERLPSQGRLRTHRAEQCHGERENQETVHAKLLSDRTAMSNLAKIFCSPGRAIKTNRRAKPLALPNATRKNSR